MCVCSAVPCAENNKKESVLHGGLRADCDKYRPPAYTSLFRTTTRVLPSPPPSNKIGRGRKISTPIKNKNNKKAPSETKHKTVYSTNEFNGFNDSDVTL
jgi:hypothetical protein